MYAVIIARNVSRHSIEHYVCVVIMYVRDLNVVYIHKHSARQVSSDYMYLLYVVGPIISPCSAYW